MSQKRIGGRIWTIAWAIMHKVREMMLVSDASAVQYAYTFSGLECR